LWKIKIIALSGLMAAAIVCDDCHPIIVLAYQRLYVHGERVRFRVRHLADVIAGTSEILEVPNAGTARKAATL
jgi:hypothetical protein